METKNESENIAANHKSDDTNTLEASAIDNNQEKRVKAKSSELLKQFGKIIKCVCGKIEPILKRLDGFILLWFSVKLTHIIETTNIKVWVCKHIFLDPNQVQQCSQIFTNRFIFPIVICLSICALLALIFYYVCKKTKGWEKYTREYQTFKFGSDLAKILSWCFSANGLLFIISITIVSLMVFIMCNFYNLAKGDRTDELQLIAITITISLSAIIPAVISKILARSEIVSIIEEKLKQELREYDISLYNIRRDKAHASRMSAVFLFQLASQQKDLAIDKGNKLTSTDNLQLALKNATWSIGWASVAVSQYILVRDQEPEADALCKELMSDYFSKYEKLITECMDHKNEETINKDKEIFRSRDFISLVIMHALIRHFRYLKGNEEIIIKLEKLFIEENPDNKHIDIDCSVLGLGKESKEEITKLTKNIVAQLIDMYTT